MNNNPATRILVTGANGFVGSHVVRTLRDHTDWRLRLFDVGDKWDEIPPVDVVISLAASADPREALRSPVAAYENNVRVQVQTMEFARQTGARVLHVSTNEATNPNGPYAGGKACQEIICGSYPDVPSTIVVTQSLFGERQQWDKLVPTALRSILAGEPIRLQRAGVRWASRPFLHARNLAYALLHLAQLEPWDYPPDRVHVGADRSLTVLYLVETLADVVGRRPVIEPVEAGDRPGHEVEVERIGCDLEGWQPTYPPFNALRDTAGWYLDNPEWLEPPDALADPDTSHPAPARQAA